VKISNFAKTPEELKASMGSESVTPSAKVAITWSQVKAQD
jgi:hypothetical protein